MTRQDGRSPPAASTAGSGRARALALAAGAVAAIAGAADARAAEAAGAASMLPPLSPTTVVVLCDARVPGGAEATAAAAARAGYEVIAAPGDLATVLTTFGCAAPDAACAARIAAGAGARWAVMVEVVGAPPPLVVAVRRVDATAAREVAAVSGPLPEGDGLLPALAELLAPVVGKAPRATPPAAPPPPAATPPARGTSALVVPGVAVTVAGAALLGVAGIAAWRLGVVQREFASAPNESLADLTALDEMARHGKAWAMTANLGVAIGGAALAAGVALLVVPRLVGRAPASGASDGGTGDTGDGDVEISIEPALGGLRLRW